MAEGSALGARRAEALTQVVQIVDIQIGLSLCARSDSLTAIRRNGHDGGLEVRIDIFADGRPQRSQQSPTETRGSAWPRPSMPAARSTSKVTARGSLPPHGGHRP